ncbi:hypothetical protein GCM10020366_08500 [Saccharopolyspora gregorii]|uniref:Adaptor protein ClpS core domain-containing protein n=1 Tax=Saccharopolyspora gregorii TaxID=33914 RepID=A0ABP6RMV7_9PSEU
MAATARPLRRCARIDRAVDMRSVPACEHGDMTSPAELERAQLEPAELGDEDKPWVTVVWNDPVNLMSYVTYVLQKIFGYSRTTRPSHARRPQQGPGRRVLGRQGRRSRATSRNCTPQACGPDAERLVIT